jgi:hypothetical protein
LEVVGLLLLQERSEDERNSKESDERVAKETGTNVVGGAVDETTDRWVVVDLLKELTGAAVVL